MTEIFLHGLVAKKFKSHHKFYNINKPTDCVNAIEVNCPGFKKFFQKSSINNMEYEMIVNGNSLKDAHSALQKQEIKTIEIVPAISGAGNFVAAFVVQLVIGLVSAGVQYLLTPVPEHEPAQAIIQPKPATFAFTNRDNKADQFTPVPLGYGALRIGSKIVESTLEAVDLSTTDARSNPKYGEKTAGENSLPG